MYTFSLVFVYVFHAFHLEFMPDAAFSGYVYTRRRTMSDVITLRLSKEGAALLEAYMEREGIDSRGKAVKRIVEERLASDAEYDALEPLVARLEERVARVSSRGTKASLAALCLLAAREDDAMGAKLGSMPAGKVFGYAWDMAGSLMSHGTRPDFYKAAKHSSLMRAREKSDDDERLHEVMGLPMESVVASLDHSDVDAWLEAASAYSDLRDLIEGNPEGSSDEWLRSYPSYCAARAAMLGILDLMEIESAADSGLIADEDMAFSYEEGWFDVSGDEDEKKRRAARLMGADYAD